MKRFVASLACLLLTTASPLFAQNVGDPIYLTVHPAELPQPTLKYHLFPERDELTDGNAPTQYYRAFALFFENPELLTDLRGEHWELWQTMPLKELPRKEVEEKVNRARYIIREMEIAGKRKQSDWQLENRSEGIGLIIPDVQGFRILGRPLAVSARQAIAAGRYDEACRMLQIGYALAYHLGRGPTLIHVLVGMAVANMMTQQLETLLQQPDAPNLYWAIAVLPRPFADLKPALHEETLWIENMFPWIKKLDAVPMSEEQVKAVEVKLEKIMQEFGVRKPSTGQKVAQAFALTQVTAEAKRELVAHYGFSAEQVAAMPSFQVAALYSFREYKEAIEEIVKWGSVPEGWKYADFKAADERYGKALKRLDDLYFRGLLNGLTSGSKFPLENVSLAAARVDRRFAALQCVEAIRRYAAKHEGKLPAALADMKELPLPADPLTGKPFEYAADGDKATLMLAKPTEEKPNPKELLKFYITMKHAKE